MGFDPGNVAKEVTRRHDAADPQNPARDVKKGELAARVFVNTHGFDGDALCLKASLDRIHIINGKAQMPPVLPRLQRGAARGRRNLWKTRAKPWGEG